MIERKHQLEETWFLNMIASSLPGKASEFLCRVGGGKIPFKMFSKVCEQIVS